MKVLVTTIVALNPGDAAILLGTTAILRRAFGPNVEITAVDKQATKAAKLYPWMRFVPSLFGRRQRSALGQRVASLGYEHRLERLDDIRLRVAARLLRLGLRTLAATLVGADQLKVIQEYLEADLILASGGTYLVPVYGMESPLRDYEFTRALGKSLGFMPQSMGPFTGTRLTARYRVIFEDSRFILVRDQQSRRHLVELGVREELISVVPDAAFALCDPQKLTSLHKGAPTPLRVAVSVREWKHFPGQDATAAEIRYLSGVAALVTHLVEQRDASVTFLSSCQGIPDYWTDDSRTAARVIAMLPPAAKRRVSLDSTFRDPVALAEALESFDLVVATRMHVAILALCTGRPVLPVAYEFKTRELFDGLGLERFVVPIERADGPTLISTLTRLVEEWDLVRSAGSQGVKAFAAALSEADRRLVSTLKSD